MTRDPPSLMSSSELRDLSLEPSDVRPAKIAIVHPQLRDLVLPLERGHVLYPRGLMIEEQRWSPKPDTDHPEAGPSKGFGHLPGTTRTFARLGFTPICLSATGPIVACGGQHGDLHITNLPSRTPSAHLASTGSRSTTTPIKPFTLSAVLPSRSINNSMLILPSWPNDWRQREKRQSPGYVGRHDESDHEGMDRDDEEDDQEMMDVDEERGDVPSPARSPATYPNNLPFLHPPRIPAPPEQLQYSASSSRRHSSSYDDRTPRSQRSSFSSSVDRPGLPPIQYVSSFPQPRRGTPSHLTLPVNQSMGSSAPKRRTLTDEPRILISNNDQSVKMFSLRPVSSHSAASDPRLPSPPTRNLDDVLNPMTSAMRRTASSSTERGDLPRDYPGYTLVHNEPRVNIPRDPGPPPARFGSSLGWDSIGVNEGLRSIQSEREVFQREIDNIRRDIRSERERWRDQMEQFERIVGMRVAGRRSSAGYGVRSEEPRRSQCPSPPGAGQDGQRQERKLSLVGDAKFNCPMNHSSLSPDLKTMVSVGDSTDVHLFEVIDGGRDFRKVATYTAGTDAMFSTSWSKDGRKFAVANQDGEVTVWDRRSSRPLATFHTSAAPISSSPSFSSDLATSRMRSTVSSRRPSSIFNNEYDSPYQTSNPDMILVDPVTGTARSGRSTSGREPARVVKFSPEGSSRDLLVFSEEDSNIHIIDARTFQTHVIVPVPHTSPYTPGTVDPRHLSSYTRERNGVEGGVSGIAGVAFDPSGDWLYSGTEKTIVEWDMRKFGGGESGTWQMA